MFVAGTSSVFSNLDDLDSSIVKLRQVIGE